MRRGPLFRSVAGLFQGRSRKVTVSETRAHVEFRQAAGVEQLRALAGAVQRVASALGDVSWVEVNADTHRVVFAFEGNALSAADLSAIVAEAESLAGLAGAEFSEAERRHPADVDEAMQRVVELAADAAAFSAGLVLRLSPLPALPFGGNLVAGLSLMRAVPRLRRGLEGRLGRERAEFTLNLASSLAQTLAQRPLNSLVEGLHKLSMLTELRAQAEVWRQRETELCRPAPAPLVGATERRPRPVPLPRGPIEEYADQAVFVSLGGAALSFLTTRSFQRASAALFGALPRPARLGREAFASRLSQVLAERGIVVLDHHVLRRLDRIDCLVLHADLLSRRPFLIGGIRADDPEDTVEARHHAQQLFNPKRPLERRTDGLWELLPWRRSDAHADPELRAHAEQRAREGALMLSLERAGRCVAAVEVEILAQTGVEELIAAAHRAEMRVVIASSTDDVLQDLNADDVISDSEGLLSGVVRLQREGQAVCLVAPRNERALAAADCAVGLVNGEGHTPWSADLLVGNDLTDVHMIIAACAAARRLAKQAVNIALGAATLGTVASAGGLLPLTHRRVMFVVNGATLISMFNGVSRARALEARALPAPNDPTPWHALEPEGVLARLGSGEHGLEPSEVQRRRAGREPEREPRPLEGLGEAITDELFNPLAPLLAAGAALSAMVGSTSDAGVLGGVVGLNAVVGGLQRYRTERRIRILSRRTPVQALVRRHGSERVVSQTELVPGDLLVLNPGDTVPADCRVVEASGLEIDASSFTGESLPVHKSGEPSFELQIADRRSMLYAGTAIATGRGLAVVVATGDSTAAGLGASAAKPSQGSGGVEKRLRALMDLTAPVAATACIGVVAGGLLRGRKLEDLVGSGVSLAVASVPEGLPVLATAAQLSAAERLSARQALVRNPKSIEALGRVNVICLDKTGTLTRGELELSKIFTEERFVSLDSATAAARAAVAVGCRATAAEQSRLGAADPTDSALRSAAAKLGVGVASGATGFQRASEIAFAPGRNFHATLASTADGPLLSIKGAPEVVLERCTTVGDGRALGGEERQELLSQAAASAEQGLRVLALAERRMANLAVLEPRDVVELRFVGLLAFADPVRPSAKRAIEGMRRAGVEPLMITGDHPSTARAISAELGVLRHGRVVTGGELSLMSDEALDREIDSIEVFARVTPAQKVRVVRALQRTGRAVGMVGDGTNDAPAIRLADCGIALGEEGTAAARGAADVVLVDGRVETLVDAVIEGRAMWASVRDAVSILVGGNLGEIGFTLGVGLVDGRPPLNARQLLLVNLLTDVAPAMAIALRPPSGDAMESLARMTPEETLGRPLNRQIAFRAAATAAGASAAWTFARLTGSATRARTVGLAALVGSQLGQTLRSGGLSRPVVVTSLLSAGALVGVIQTPGLSHFFGCRPLGPLGWGTALGASIGATSLASAAGRLWEGDWLGPLRVATRRRMRTGASWPAEPLAPEPEVEVEGEVIDGTEADPRAAAGTAAAGGAVDETAVEDGELLEGDVAEGQFVEGSV